MKKSARPFSFFLTIVILAIFSIIGCGQQPSAPLEPAAPQETTAPLPVPESEPSPPAEQTAPDVVAEPAPEPPAVPSEPAMPELKLKTPEGWGEPVIFCEAAVILGDEADPSCDEMYFGACIINSGDTKAENVLVKLDSYNNPCYEWNLPEIAAGEELRVSVPMNTIMNDLYIYNKAIHVRVIIDPDNTVEESNERNNQHSTHLKVANLPAPPRITLVSPENEAVLKTLTPRLEWKKPEVAATYRITVTQLFELTEYGITERVTIFTPINNLGVKDNFYDVPPGILDPGATYRWSVRSYYAGEYSDYTERIFTTPDGIDLACFPVRDWGYKAITIGTAEEVKGENAFAWDDDMYLGVAIANLGNKPAYGVVVVVNCEGHEIFRGYVDTLAGQAVTVAYKSWAEIKMVVAMEPGPKEFEIRIDPDNLVKESDDDNNNTAETLIVPGEKEGAG